MKIWAVGKYVPTEQGPTSLQALHLKTAVPNVRINCDLEFCNILIGTPADSQMYRLSTQNASISPFRISNFLVTSLRKSTPESAHTLLQSTSNIIILNFKIIHKCWKHEECYYLNSEDCSWKPMNLKIVYQGWWGQNFWHSLEKLTFPRLKFTRSALADKRWLTTSKLPAEQKRIKLSRSSDIVAQPVQVL